MDILMVIATDELRKKKKQRFRRYGLDGFAVQSLDQVGICFLRVVLS